MEDAKRIARALELDEDPARGGDILRLLKPASAGPSKKNLLTAQAYLVNKDVPQTCYFELSPQLHRALPEGIQLAIAEAECDATMGLFVDIQRVWVIVDNILFLWDYQQAGNAYETWSNKQNDQLLVSVALCRPKPDFTSPYNAAAAQGKGASTKPDFLLVLTTFIDITVLRLDRSSAAGGWLIQETGISSSTDGTMMRQVQGTSDGRIFLAGEDGAVHELVYESKRNFMHRLGIKRQCFTLDRSGKSALMSWLVPPIIQRVMTSTGLVEPTDALVSLFVDNSRKLLYALSKRNKLLLFNLQGGASSGGSSDQDAPISFVTQFDFAHMDKTLDFRLVDAVGVKPLDLAAFEVGSVNIIPASTSSSVHLVVIGKRGIRLYFTTCASISALLTSKQRQVTGKALNPICIRAPPDARALHTENAGQGSQGGYAPIPASAASTSNLLLSSYSNSQVSILAGTKDFTLLSLCLHSTNAQQWTVEEGLREHVELMPMSELGTRVYAVEEITTTKPPRSGEMLNELASQYVDAKPAFLLLTNRGVRLLVKNRPVETLQYALERISKSALAENFAKNFFLNFGLDEACCMMLHLASSNDSRAVLHNPVFVDRDWAHSLLSSKAGHFLSSLGFLLPRAEAAAVKLPALKSDLERDREQERATQTAQQLHRGGSAAAPPVSAKTTLSANRAILVTSHAIQPYAPAALDAAQQGTAAFDLLEQDTHFSGCFQGLVLLLARLLRPIWKATILTTTAAAGGSDLRWSAKELEQLLAPLLKLKHFMETRHPFQQAVQSKSPNQVRQWTPFLVEELRTRQVYGVLQRACEALHLFGEVQTRCSSSNGSAVAAAAMSKKLARAIDAQLTTWGEFVSNEQIGQRIARQLINAGTQQLSLGSSGGEEEGLLLALGQVSPSYFSAAHYQFLQAMQEFVRLEENAMLSSETRQAKLTRAIGLVKQSLAGEAHVSLDRLQQVADKLQQSGEEVWRLVELSAAAAAAAGNSMAEAKQKAYQICFDAIARVAKPPSSPSRAQKRAWDQVLQNSDLQMHYYFFQRWIAQGEISLMFDLVTTLGNKQDDSATGMEAFLKDGALNTYKQEEHEDAHLQLLAKWLVLVGRTQDAAEVYLRLAKIDNKFPLHVRNPVLARRNEYLNNAMVLATNSSSNNAIRRELALFKCRMDVYEALQAAAQTSALPVAEEDLTRLQYCLVNETELLNKFAYKYELWEECIAIIQNFGRLQAEAIGMLPSLYGALVERGFKPKFDAQLLLGIVARLARRFGRDALVFPLNDLVVSLERAKTVAFDDEEEEEESELEEIPAYDWLARTLLIDGAMPPEPVFVAYVRYLNAWCETERQYVNALRILFYVVREWRQVAPQELGAKVMHPLAGEARDLIGVGPTLRLLVDRLNSAAHKREFEDLLAGLKLGDLIKTGGEVALLL